MAVPEKTTTITVMSNDGSNTLATVDYSNYMYAITVTTTGFTAEHDGSSSDYVYAGTGTFLGISNSPNTITPDYAIGTVFYPSSDYPTFYIVEEVEEETKTVNFDLSTLNLSAGTHEITVKARASGYTDSVASNAVSYVVEGELITFTIDGTSYTAIDGMTWEDWIISEYNTNGFYHDGATVLIYKSGVRYSVDNAWSDGLIVANTSYTTSVFSGSTPT